MTEEQIIQSSIMLDIGKHRQRTRVFRNNVGTGWQGEVTRKGSLLIIQNPRPLQAGLCQGSSDLIGWTAVQITPDMVGKTIAAFTAIEVKTARGRVSEDQENFIKAVQQAGGIAGIARSADEALGILR